MAVAVVSVTCVCVCMLVCPGRYIVSTSDAHELSNCVIINGDLAIQLSGSSKLDVVRFMSCLYHRHAVVQYCSLEIEMKCAGSRAS